MGNQIFLYWIGFGILHFLLTLLLVVFLTIGLGHGKEHSQTSEITVTVIAQIWTFGLPIPWGSVAWGFVFALLIMIFKSTRQGKREGKV